MARSISSTVYSFSPIRGEGKASGHVVELLLLTLILGEPDTRHLGVAVRHARYVVVLDRVGLLPGDELRDDRSLAETFVGQHGRSGDITNREVAGRGRLEVFVDFDKAAVREL